MGSLGDHPLRHATAVNAPWRGVAYPLRPVDRRPSAARRTRHGLMSHMNTIQMDNIPMVLRHAARRITHEPGRPARVEPALELDHEPLEGRGVAPRLLEVLEHRA